MGPIDLLMIIINISIAHIGACTADRSGLYVMAQLMYCVIGESLLFEDGDIYFCV